MVNISLHRLTPSQPSTGTFHFLGRDRKDIYYLDHNFDDHVHHRIRSCNRCDANVYVKPLKEMFDAVEDFDEPVLTRAGIFSRLGALSVKIDYHMEHKNTDRGKNANSRKNYFYWWECLESKN